MKNKLYYQFLGSFFLLIFMFLGYVVRFYPEWLHAFDQTITRWVRAPYPNMNSFFIWYTKFANPLSIVLITATLIFLFIKSKYYIEALWLFMNTAIIAGMINPLLKLVFKRPRPTLEHLVTEHSFSFPSGHSIGSILLYGTLIFLLPHFIKSRRICLIIQIGLSCAIFLVGISRIYLGVHFPSDIVGGFSLGLGWLFLTYPIYLEKQFVFHFKNKEK